MSSHPRNTRRSPPKATRVRSRTRGTTRTAEPDTRRTELLAAAASAIARLGFDRVRLRDVADEAGVSIGLLQHYFYTREQLGHEAFAYVCQARASRITEASADAMTSWQRIEIYLREGLEWRDLFDRSKTWIDLVAAAARDPALQRQTALSLEIWRSPLLSAIEAGTAAGELHPIVTPAAAADALLALIDGTELRVVADNIDDRAIGERTVSTAIVIARHLLGVDRQR